jgi:hypothetical protein
LNEPRHPPEVMQVELASLVYLLGGMAPRHLVAIGGLVPPLLVPEAPSPHRGSADIDLSLSMAITKGETSEYYRSLEAAIEPYFEPVADSGFRWRKRDGVAGVRLIVDFMGPDSEATYLEDGTLQLEDSVATANTGVVLRPYPLSAAAIVEEDARSAEIENVALVYHPGVHADVTIRHTGPVGFLASKGDAFTTRSDDKDGYDVSWVCLHAGESPDAVAEWVMDCPAFKNGYFQESVDKLQKAFKEVTYPGPSGYAKEMNPNREPGSDDYDRDRNAAYLRVAKVLAILRDHLWVGLT